MACASNYEECAKLFCKYGGQKGRLLANIFARRIQKYYRQYKLRRETSTKQSEKSNSPIKNNSFDETASGSLVSLRNSNINLRKQSQPYLDNKNVFSHPKPHSLRSHSLMTNSLSSNESFLEVRRHNFAKSKTIMESINQIEESKYFLFLFSIEIQFFFLLCFSRVDPANKIIIQASTSVSTYNKLYDRRKIIAEELHKLKQARIQNHYVCYIK